MRRNVGVYLMKTNGLNQTQVTGFETNDENASISPDGKQIVYQSSGIFNIRWVPGA